MFTKMGLAQTHRVNTVADDWKGDDRIGRPDSSELQKLIDRAVTFASERSGKSVEEITSKVKAGDLWANSSVRYAIAKGIASLLQGHPQYHGLAVFGDVVDDQAYRNSDIDLILHIAEDKELFENWVELMDEGLTEHFRQTFDLGEGFVSLLDVHVVTDEEVKRRAGFGSMLTSAHANLTQL